MAARCLGTEVGGCDDPADVDTLAATAGLTPETFAYLRDLAANNDRVWFEDNRDRYNVHRMTPAKSVVAALGQVVEGFRPQLRAELAIKKSIRRINRDTRFSKDKTPYGPQIRLIL
ncbi:MAG: DUF2461 family protein [Pseudomonadota bacterium]